jgi:hypothetical protein
MVKLHPALQQEFLRLDPANFKPAAGKWGEGGATIISLANADLAVVTSALSESWRNNAPKILLSKQN